MLPPPLPSSSTSSASLYAIASGAFVLAFLGFATPAAAQSAILTPLDQAPPTHVDVRAAVAVTPDGSTRWNEISLPANGRALWLVAVKPGATVDWAPRRWIDALDEATTPRIIAPSSSTECSMRTSPEVVRPWTSATASERRAEPTVAASADAVVSYATAHGYRVSTPFIDALTRLYADGWRVAMIDAQGDSMPTTFGPLRVTDDAGPVLPMSLASGLPTELRMTTFTIGPGRTSFAALGVVDVDRSAITWGPAGSNYVPWREALLTNSGGSHWLRESSAHDVVFDGVPLGTGQTRSVAEAYFSNANCTQWATENGASTAPAAAGAFACGEERDLALALSSAVPASIVASRWAGTLPAGALGTNVALSFGSTTSHGPVYRASSYEACTGPSADSPYGSSSGSPSSGSGGSTSGAAVVPVYVDSEGCSSSEPVVTDDPPESASEGCSSSDSSSSSSSSDSSSEGWDDDDDDSDSDSDSDDGCSSKHDSASSSDSCSGSSTSTGGESDDDGWDTEDGMSPKVHKPHAFHKPKQKRSSPVSRVALLGVALVLPFRRRFRSK